MIGGSMKSNEERLSKIIEENLKRQKEVNIKKRNAEQVEKLLVSGTKFFADTHSSIQSAILKGIINGK